MRAHSSYSLVVYRSDVEDKSHQTAHWNELISSKTPWRAWEGDRRASAALPILDSEVTICPQEYEFWLQMLVVLSS